VVRDPSAVSPVYLSRLSAAHGSPGPLYRLQRQAAATLMANAVEMIITCAIRQGCNTGLPHFDEAEFLRLVEAHKARYTSTLGAWATNTVKKEEN
jgi:hypothetical protein